MKKTCVFGESSDEDEVEEMPPEAKMRMKNIGRFVKFSKCFKSFEFRNNFQTHILFPETHRHLQDRIPLEKQDKDFVIRVKYLNDN